MPNIDALKLTLDAIYLTFTGQAPVSVWEPLFEDIIRIAAENILRLLGVLP